MSISPNTQCCHSTTMLCYGKTCVFYDHTKRISVIIIFCENNVIMKVMQDFFVLVYLCMIIANNFNVNKSLNQL